MTTRILHCQCNTGAHANIPSCCCLANYNFVRPYNQKFDPVYTAAVQERNIKLHTVFTSENRLLTLISVTPFWAVALKLVRYTKWDPGDICFLLRLVSITPLFFSSLSSSDSSHPMLHGLRPLSWWLHCLRTREIFIGNGVHRLMMSRYWFFLDGWIPGSQGRRYCCSWQRDEMRSCYF